MYIDAFAARSHAPVTKHARNAERKGAHGGQTHAMALPGAGAAQRLPSMPWPRTVASAGGRMQPAREV